MIDRDTIRELQAIRQAEAETGIVGKSSSGAVYRAALGNMGVAADGMTAIAAKVAYQALRTGPRAKQRVLTADAKTVADRTARFPNANRLLNPFG